MSSGGRDRDSDGVGGSGDGDGGDAAQQPVDAPSWKKILPFLIALGVVVTVVAVLVISNITRPPEGRVNDSTLVQYAVNDMYSARNDLDYERYVATLCAADRAPGVVPERADFIEDNRRSLDANGRITIPEMTDLVVTGDRASVDVRWNFDGQEDQTQVTSMIVVREDGEWKVCKA